jgi:hypothetical protein
MSLDELDSAFKTLEIINGNDIDVYIKMLMFMKPGKKQHMLRSELCHVAKPYIEEDKDICNILNENNYFKYDTRFIDDISNKVKTYKIDLCKKYIEMTFKNCINNIPLSADKINNVMDEVIDHMEFGFWKDDFSYGKYEDKFIPYFRDIYTATIMIFRTLCYDINFWNDYLSISHSFNEKGKRLNIAFEYKECGFDRRDYLEFTL